MSITRAQVRAFTLAPYFNPANLPVRNEVSPWSCSWARSS